MVYDATSRTTPKLGMESVGDRSLVRLAMMLRSKLTTSRASAPRSTSSTLTPATSSAPSST